MFTFIYDNQDAIKGDRDNWQNAVSNLIRLEAKTRVADIFDTEVVNLIRDETVNPVFKQILVNFISEKDRLINLLLDRELDLNLRKLIACSLPVYIEEPDMQSLTQELIENNNLELARFVFNMHLLGEEESSYIRENRPSIEWDGLIDKLINQVNSLSREELISAAGLDAEADMEKIVSNLTSSFLVSALNEEQLLTELMRLGQKEFSSRLREIVFYGSLKLYRAIVEKLRTDAEMTIPDFVQGSIEPDLKMKIWDVLGERGEIYKIADFYVPDEEFWRGGKIHGQVYDFGSYNRYEEDLSQRAEDSFSRSIKYGNSDYAIKIYYDIDSPNPAEVGFWMKLNGLDASDYKYLKLHLKGDPLLGYPEKIKIEIKNAKGECGVYYLTGINEHWQEFIIPLAEFKGITDLSSLKEIVFVFNKDELSQREGRIYLDLIELSKEEMKDKKAMADKLISVLDTENREIITKAINALGRLGVVNAEVREILLTVINNPQPEIRGASAEAIGRLGLKELVEPLKRLFEDKSEEVRFKVLKALIEINTSQELLEKALEDTDWKIRKIAIGSMEESEANIFKEKLKLMLLEDPSWQVRAQTALILAQTKDLTLEEVFNRVLLDENPWVRLAALYGLHILRN